TKSIFEKQFFRCVRQIFLQVIRRNSDFIENRVAPIDHGDKVLQIMAGEEVSMAASPKGFHFGAEKKWSCDNSDGRAERQLEQAAFFQSTFVPDVGVAKHIFIKG